MVTVQIDARRLGPADWVTSARLMLSSVVAVLVVAALRGHHDTVPLVALAGLALVLDLVDGQVARRTGTASAAGARFDMEVDAFLILVLSVYAAATIVPWAILIGLARYLLLVAGRRWPWLRGETPPRRWAKVVAAVQGGVLLAVATGLLPRPAAQILLAVALVLLAASFAHQVILLRRLRPIGPAAEPWSSRHPVGSTSVTVAAYAVVWLALALPDRAADLAPDRLIQLPVELIALVVLGLVLPGRVRRVAGLVFGLLVGLTLLVKVLDIGFFAFLDRPVNVLGDSALIGPGLGVLRDSDGRLVADVAVAALVLLILAILVVLPQAGARVGASVARHRAAALPLTAVLGLVWVGISASGLQLASHSTSTLAVGEARSVYAGLADPRIFGQQIANDPYADTPPSRLLTALRGKDVLFVFVESYGQVAVQDSSIAPGVDAILDHGTHTLARAGYSARSAFLTSPTFGGVSWLAHETLQSGTWVDSQRRYDQLMSSHRLTLSSAFHSAGWRTVFDAPQVTDGWPQGQQFYGFDRIYGTNDVGYHGPSFDYAAMPDQYTWARFGANELTGPHPPVMAEIDLVSSHVPWTPLPHMVPWSRLGDGSIFDTMTAGQPSANTVLSSTARAQAAYGTSVRYTLRALIGFLRRSHDPNLVAVVLGDHQPNSTVSGTNPSHDVPISLIARHDPHLMNRISGWDWQPGLHPYPDAPVWPMSDFRDRFLSAFGPNTHRPSKGATP
jgi:phosphatidylglycerophosphate synthase